jgi:hypothetical protein
MERHGHALPNVLDLQQERRKGDREETKKASEALSLKGIYVAACQREVGKLDTPLFVGV